MQAIQLAAGDAFRDVGMSSVAESPPLPAESLSGYREAGRAWVAVDDHDEPVGFVVADVIDGAVHIEQVSVHPAYARQRIGAMLLDHVAGWAARRGLPALTLITFRGVPWNAPYYERLGFRELAPAELTPGLAALLGRRPRRRAPGRRLRARLHAPGRPAGHPPGSRCQAVIIRAGTAYPPGPSDRHVSITAPPRHLIRERPAGHLGAPGRRRRARRLRAPRWLLGRGAATASVVERRAGRRHRCGRRVAGGAGGGPRGASRRRGEAEPAPGPAPGRARRSSTPRA